MGPAREVVITGMGVVSPIGISSEAFWNAMIAGQSGIRDLGWFNGSDLPAALGAQVTDFDPARFVKPRKALKVMSRDIQLGVAAAGMACGEAGVSAGAVDPERFGVVFGADMIAAELGELESPYRVCAPGGRFDFALWGGRAMADLFPLWMLKYLPNMPACHVGIIHDARGPNNTLTLGEVSSLMAIAEATEIIRRGLADVMITGGASSRIHPTIYLRYACRQTSHRADAAAACRPFDANRDGMVYGEGACALVLEAREHAEKRGAGDKMLAQVLGSSSAFEPQHDGRPIRGDSIRRAIGGAMAASGLKPEGLSHVNAHGLSTTWDDQVEARAIRDTLGDVPVTALKSYFGNLVAAGGAVELAASVLALRHGLIPATLNYEHPDHDCPVQVVSGDARPSSAKSALLLNHAPMGQAVAMAIGAVR